MTSVSELSCPQCGNHLADDQDWCVQCGFAARTAVVAAPSWRLALLGAVFAGVLLVALLVAVVASL